MAAYEVRVIDFSGTTVAVLDGPAFQSLRYARVLNDVGTVQMTLARQDARAELLARDYLLEVQRDGQVEGTYLVKILHPFQDEGGVEWLIVGGVSLEWLLLARTIDPRNDPLAAGGFSTKSGAADTVMCELVTQQAGPGASGRQVVPGLTVKAAAGTGLTVAGRWQWENLLDVLQGLAASAHMDFTVQRTSGAAFEFSAEVAGSDRTETANWPGQPYYVFAPEKGNAAQPSLERDWRQAVTNAYLLLRGTDEIREIYERSSGHEFDTPFAYFAVVSDARQTESPTEYQTQALELLVKQRASVKFAFKTADAAAQYRVQWNLGDRVTARWNGFTQDLRITGIDVQVDAQGETLTPTLEVI